MTKTLKIILVDADAENRKRLKKLIDNYCPEFLVVGEAENALSGVKLINKHSPDIIITDIDMSGGSGFDMLDCISDKNVSIIIGTAFNNYAIEAFKYNITDYLLKPINIDALLIALKKAKKQRNKFFSTTLNYNEIMNGKKTTDLLKLSIHSQNEIEFIEIDSIVRMEAAGCYTNIYLDSGRKITVSKSLGDYESILFEDEFVRVHNSHIVNLKHIRKFIKKDGLILKMMDDFSVPIAVRRKDIFENKLKRIAI